jgi:hypothetical protein
MICRPDAQPWEQPGKRFATAFLSDWIKRAEGSGIRMLRQMARTWEAHRTGLLSYYDVAIYVVSKSPLVKNRASRAVSSFRALEV